ncbi:MAG TPA: hypothetical protein EYP74_04160 [Anaerolineales bacterium]|nr:hypothetical protein [Anaerolineales bacterium]
MFKKKLQILMVLLIISMVFISCAPPAPETKIVEVEVTREVPVEVTSIVEVEITSTPAPVEEITYAEETAVQNIPLAGKLADRHAEISGMAWYGDTLILMPQYPNFYLEEGSEDNGVIFGIAKEDLLAYLNGENLAALEAIEIPFFAPEAYAIEGFEGFESITFKENTAYLTIEVNDMQDGMSAYLIDGEMSPDLSGLTLNPEVMTQIKSQSGVDNMSDEAILLVGESILTFHEANGVAVNKDTVFHVFGTDLSETMTLPFVNIEYRLTDATALDEETNAFWMINYFYPGEEVLLPEVDPIAEKFYEGPTHAASPGVERLLEFSYTDGGGVVLTDTAPIQMQLMADGNLRNWEGIVRFENGFLLATDKYPTTILGFVPLPEVEKEE